MKNEYKRSRSSRSGQTSRSDRLNAIMKKLEDGVKELFTSENYKNYLRTMSKFHRYSFNNTLLIAMQRPGSTCVAGYGAWQQKFHRQVKKGEKGITILAPVPVKTKEQPDPEHDSGRDIGASPDQSVPKAEISQNASARTDPDTEKISLFFRPVTVFDISQTEGEPLPTLGVDELTGSVEGFQAFMKAMTALSPVPIRFDTIEGGAKGYYHTVDKEIVIKKDMSESQTMKTCIHEVAHAILHDRDRMKAEGIQKDRQTKEVEAESVSFAVISFFGLDQNEDVGKAYSFPYIGLWSSSKEMKELKSSMDTIRKTAGELIEGIEAELEKLQPDRETPERPSVLAALSAEKDLLKTAESARKVGSVAIADKLPAFRKPGSRPAPQKEMVL